MDEQQLLDNFTRIDELLEKMLPVLERIAIGGIPKEVAVPREFITATKRMEDLTSSVGSLCNLLAEKSNGTVTDAPYLTFDKIGGGGGVLEEVQLINYPTSGKKDLPVGTTVIDIKSRQVILPDGSSEEIYSPFKIDMARSLVLYTDGTISVILLKDGTPVYTSSVYPLWSRFKDFEFDQMVITTTKKTLFYMGVSNTPDSVPDMIEAPYIEGNPFVYRGSVPTAGTPVEIDVRATAGYNVQTGFIANMGTTAGKLYIYEDAGEGYTSDYYTIVKDGVENLMKCNISKIKIDSNVDNTTFELNFR